MNPLTNMKNQQKMAERELEMGVAGDLKKSWHWKYRDSAWVFIGGLPYDLTEGDVLAVFSQYGEVVNLNLIRDHKTGKSKGFGFLCYEDQRSTILAVDNFNGIKILNRAIRVDHVEEYRVPKEHDDVDEETKRLWMEGCGPKPLTPPPQEEEEEVKPKKVKKEKKKKKSKKHKKEKKAKKAKKAKKRKKGASSDSSSSSSEEEKPKEMKLLPLDKSIKIEPQTPQPSRIPDDWRTGRYQSQPGGPMDNRQYGEPQRGPIPIKREDDRGSFRGAGAHWDFGKKVEPASVRKDDDPPPPKRNRDDLAYVPARFRNT